MPITPGGDYRDRDDIEADIWSTRMVYRPLLIQARRRLDEVKHLKLASTSCEHAIANASAQLDRADELEKLL